MAAGPAAADTGLKTVTISAENYQSYTDNSNRDRDDHKRDWKRCDRDRHDHGRHGYWHYGKHGKHWHWCDDDRRGRH